MTLRWSQTQAPPHLRRQPSRNRRTAARSRRELTAFGIGRLPTEPYRSFANEQTLNGMRIGVIREHMDKKVFNEADVEGIDLAERAVGDLRRLGATIVDPGPGGALFQSCLDKYLPLYRNRAFIEQFPALFPADSTGKPATDRISVLVDMFYDPSRVPAGTTIRNIRPASNAGLTKFMLSRYLRERGDANIKSIRDLIDKSNFYRDIRPEAGFIDRKAALEEMNSSLTLDMANVFQDRFANQQVVLQCMAQENLDALVSPAGNIPAYLGRAYRAAAGGPHQFCLGPAGTTRLSDVVGPGGLHHSRI